VRQLENKLLVYTASGMGGTVNLDDKEAVSINFQIHETIDERVVQSVARSLRDLARSRGLWGG
jgi:hypothetical protein